MPQWWCSVCGKLFGLKVAMRELRITVRCTANPTEHAKVVRVKARLGRRRAEELAELLDGTSLAYVHPPGPKSPIGRCCACGGEVYCEVTETVDGAIKMPGCVEATETAARRENAGARKLAADLKAARVTRGVGLAGSRMEGCNDAIGRSAVKN